MRRFSGVLSAALLIGALNGCVSKQITPEYKPRMGVARNSEGFVTFAIDSRVGYEYAIYYEDPVSKNWTPVPGCGGIRGTGDSIELMKRFNSRGPLPAFTLRHTKID